MPMLAWNDRLSVNIKEIDDQHKNLVDMINSLHDAMKSGKADSAVLGILDGMKKYAASHFATEERHMKAHNYPEFARHKTEHDAFLAKALQAEKDCAPCKCSISMDILTSPPAGWWTTSRAPTRNTAPS